MFQTPSINLLLFLPWLIIVGAAMLLMLLDLVVRSHNKVWVAWVSLIAITLAFIQTVGLWGVNKGTFTPEGGLPMIVVSG